MVFTCKEYMPIVLLVFGLVKRGSLSELNLTNCSLRKGESCRAVASLHNFWRKTDSESCTLSRFFVVLSSEAKVVLIFTPPRAWGETAIQHNEKLIQVRNKEGCFAYQLLTTSRAAFGCCLWFCRCMPSCGSMVMDPFPRKLHWNILTVTFA